MYYQKSSLDTYLQRFVIAVVIPAYNVERKIEGVLKSLPSFMRHIIVVDDASSDRTNEIAQQVASSDSRIILIKHQTNQGVGGAMITGFNKALELKPQIVVKIDGDGQMPLEHLTDILLPLIKGEADYTKGNRFYELEQLRQMPFPRLLGNGILGFVVRFVSGYWNIYDPTNGYVAINSEILKRLEFNQLDRRYFFETSMLINLNLMKAKVVDIPIPAVYRNEQSSLRIGSIIMRFPWLLIKGFLRRLWFRHLLSEFTIVGLFFVLGSLLFSFGSCFGLIKWIKSSITGSIATAGTVMLAALPLLLGFILIVEAIALDITGVPTIPLSHSHFRFKKDRSQDKL